MNSMPLSLLGVHVHPLDTAALTEKVIEAVSGGERCIVANHNLHSVYLHERDERFRAFHRLAYITHVDGMSLVFAGRILGVPLRRAHRVTYADWLEPLMATASQYSWRVLYLGGAESVAERGIAVLRQRHPGLVIEGMHGFFDVSRGGVENRAVLERIRAFAPHLLMVGMGMPRQEHWIAENYEALPKCVVVTAGAALDYVAGAIPTPPRWAGAIGAEWIFRLVAEPGRLWRRYLIEPWPVLIALARELALSAKRRREAGPPR